MIRRYFQAIRIYVSIIHDKMAVHGLIKLDDKVILKIIQLYFLVDLIYVVIINDIKSFIRHIKFYDKVIIKILRCSATIAGIITNNLIFFWYNLDERTFVESVNDNIRTIRLRKSKVEHDSPL